jgi:hypothetical protein
MQKLFQIEKHEGLNRPKALILRDVTEFMGPDVGTVLLIVANKDTIPCSTINLGTGAFGRVDATIRIAQRSC